VAFIVVTGQTMRWRLSTDDRVLGMIRTFLFHQK
jgi:hypothetical protein